MKCEKLLSLIRDAYLTNWYPVLSKIQPSNAQAKLNAQWNVRDSLRFLMLSNILLNSQEDCFLIPFFMHYFWRPEPYSIFIKSFPEKAVYLFNGLKRYWFPPYITFWNASRGYGNSYMQGLRDVIVSKWFSVWSSFLLSCRMGAEWLKHLSDAISQKGFAPGVKFDFGSNGIADVEIECFAAAIKEKWFEEWVRIDLGWNAITDIWCQYLLDAIKECKLQKWVHISLMGNPISDEMQALFKEEITNQWFDPAYVIHFSAKE